MAQTFPRNIDIQTNVPTELWLVTGDATQLHQVLLNLCVNARDAMPQGGTLTLGAENIEVDEHLASMNPGAQLGPHLLFRVADTGTGISNETMEKMFDPFFTTKEVGKGTGLGLATVIGIVKSHDGFLTVQSEIGVGTTFKVFVPASPDEHSASETRDVQGVSGGNGELVLVVDDEAPIREALVRTLQGNGYRAYTAEDGTDALALYFQRRRRDRCRADRHLHGPDGRHYSSALLAEAKSRRARNRLQRPYAEGERHRIERPRRQSAAR
jgi:CheY-like chemotaxis protein